MILTCGFRKYLNLAGIHPSACQTVSLSRGKAATILSAARSSIQTEEVSHAYAEDLQDEIKPVFAEVKFPAGGLFMALGCCSLKDAASKGQRTVQSADKHIFASLHNTYNLPGHW